MTKFASLLFILFSIIACQNKSSEASENGINDTASETEPAAQKDLSIAQTIAYKNGLEHWNEVEEIAFTFNVSRTNRHFERTFIWKPKTNDVTYISRGDTLTYNRNNLDSIATAADRAFINDKYWLLAPFQLVWDEGIAFTETENVVAPISKDTLNVLTIVYSDNGGYTPGDAYDLYYDTDFMIREWVFREGNGETADMINTWEEYTDFNGLKLATMHRDTTPDFKLYFTNISIK